MRLLVGSPWSRPSMQSMRASTATPCPPTSPAVEIANVRLAAVGEVHKPRLRRAVAPGDPSRAKCGTSRSISRGTVLPARPSPRRETLAREQTGRAPPLSSRPTRRRSLPPGPAGHTDDAGNLLIRLAVCRSTVKGETLGTRSHHASPSCELVHQHRQRDGVDAGQGCVFAGITEGRDFAGAILRRQRPLGGLRRTTT